MRLMEHIWLRKRRRGRTRPKQTDTITPAQISDSIVDAVADLGKPDEIGKVFSGFQKYLYAAVV